MWSLFPTQPRFGGFFLTFARRARQCPNAIEISRLRPQYPPVVPIDLPIDVRAD
jgi:hypothetical protein